MIRFLAGTMTVCLLVAGCASTGKKPKPEREKPSAETGRQRVTLEQAGGYSLDQTVRRVGEEYGGGLVVMNGVGDRILGPLAVKDAGINKLAIQLAEDTECAYQETPHYYFLYPASPPGYESLLNLSVQPSLDARYAGLTVSMAFGDNTELFNVFAVLSRNLGVTIVGDAAVAESGCGELALTEVPLWAGLDALLKSARVSPEFLEVDSTPEYIFFSTAGNPNPRSALLNESELSAEQLALLDRPVTVILPEPPASGAGISFHRGGRQLHLVQETLSRQLGMPVVVQPDLEKIPINPCVMNNVRVRTAMDLLIRQWLSASYGYELRDGSIVIRRKSPPK